MQFRALVKPSSATYRSWRQAATIGGNVSGIRFRYATDGTYYSGVLTPEEVEAARDNPMLVLEVCGLPDDVDVPRETSVVAGLGEAPKAAKKPPAPVAPQRPVPPKQWRKKGRR